MLGSQAAHPRRRAHIDSTVTGRPTRLRSRAEAGRRRRSDMSRTSLWTEDVSRWSSDSKPTCFGRGCPGTGGGRGRGTFQKACVSDGVGLAQARQRPPSRVRVRVPGPRETRRGRPCDAERRPTASRLASPTERGPMIAGRLSLKREVPRTQARRNWTIGTKTKNETKEKISLDFFNFEKKQIFF